MDRGRWLLNRSKNILGEMATEETGLRFSWWLGSRFRLGFTSWAEALVIWNSQQRQRRECLGFLDQLTLNGKCKRWDLKVVSSKHKKRSQTLSQQLYNLILINGEYANDVFNYYEIFLKAQIFLKVIAPFLFLAGWNTGFMVVIRAAMWIMRALLRMKDTYRKTLTERSCISAIMEHYSLKTIDFWTYIR